MNILITGASRGVGYELAKLLAAQGHCVLAVARTKEKMQLLERESSDLKGAIHSFTADLAKSFAVDELVQQIRLRFKSLDVLVNNAGALVSKPFNELSEDDFNLMLDANLRAPFYLIRAMKSMMPAGSHIVNIGSMGGFQGSAKFPGLSIYSASKGALAILSECLAEEFKEDGIKVNCLALGAAQTEMLAEAFPGYKAPLTAAGMAAFIADFSVNGSKYFNGKVVPVSVSTP
ncbi:MAG: SDR family oxidoreductase [Bacteroidota bacterium]|nr:SDR family oxidoreductase [Bacteroidota bacterium]